MPLRRDPNHQPIAESDLQTVRFPLTDGSQLVWGEVSDLALRERAARDKLKPLEKRALLEHYRKILEKAASQLFDEGKFGKAADGATVVRVPAGRL